ncbi:MAG: DDE-type integrase/transposase/recombinase [Pirellulales bacterium]
MSSYYRWLSEEAWSRQQPGEPVRPVQAFEALPEERQAVCRYALEHAGIRHRELAWRMIDDDVAYLSASTVYRILREEELVSTWGKRKKRYREEREKARWANDIWGTDIMYLTVGGHPYFFIAFIDEYSRYIVHHQLLTTIDGPTLSLAAQQALETLPRSIQEGLSVKPTIRSDNGSGYISKEFRGLLEHHGLTHHRITPHCPEENGVMERANRTLREALEDVPLENRFQAEEILRSIVNRYNQERLHSALGYLRPVDYYRGEPDRLHADRRLKVTQARHRRKQINLKIRQRTLPLETNETVSYN